jgi:MSHA biogenesis protein MshK
LLLPLLPPLLLALVWQAGAARAQGLVDPTRPPPEALTSGPASAAAAPAELTSEPQLQSILVSKQPGGRRVAVIDGQTLRVGDKVDGARLLSLGDTQAVLERGGKRQVLRLFGEAPAGTDAKVKAGKGLAAPAAPQAAAAKPSAAPSAMPPAVPKPQAATPPSVPQPAAPQSVPQTAPAPARGDPNLL